MDRFGNGWLVRGKSMEAFRGVFGSVRWILLGSPHSLVGGNPEGHWTAAIFRKAMPCLDPFIVLVVHDSA